MCTGTDQKLYDEASQILLTYFERKSSLAPSLQSWSRSWSNPGSAVLGASSVWVRTSAARSWLWNCRVWPLFLFSARAPERTAGSRRKTSPAGGEARGPHGTFGCRTLRRDYKARAGSGDATFTAGRRWLHCGSCSDCTVLERENLSLNLEPHCRPAQLIPHFKSLQANILS